MKRFIYLLVLFTCVSNVEASTPTPTEIEFKQFFKDGYSQTYRESNVSIFVDRADNVSRQNIPVELKFDIKKVDKLLILKIPESGYDNMGDFNQSCKDEPVFVAGYTLDPKENMSKISLRMRSQCGNNQIRILVWVRTSDNKYYLGKKTFFAYVP